MKNRTSFVCQQCGYDTPEWYGKCPSCGEWNSLVEMKESRGSNSSSISKSSRASSIAPQKLSDVKHIEKNRLKSGFIEFDRVMGGGIVSGSVTLLAGDPGIGKSTLLLHILGAVGGVYVSGEESPEQVKLRAKRLGINGENITILAETAVEGIVTSLESLDEAAKAKSLVIIDSIQTLASEDLDGMAGSVGQIRRSAELLIGVAKRHGISIIIIGHVTKEGAIAGPKVLEHMVDTVLYLEGERFANARILRTLKNRFGAVEEVGIFEMLESGLKEVTNPSALFLQDRVKNVSGSIVTVILEGTRPMLIEIQGLVVTSQLAMPRRVGNGFDYNRMQLLIAILQKRLNIPLGMHDVFVNVSGGLKIDEPAADLAVCFAILSSFKNKPVDSKIAIFGEVGLLGEIRRVAGEDRRVKEAKRLGFTTIYSPATLSSLSKASQLLI